MRLGRWVFEETEFEGLFIEQAGELSAAPFADGTTVQQLLELGLVKALDQAPRSIGETRHNLADIRLLAPFKPITVRDGVAFESHVEGVVKSIDSSEGVVAEWYEFPTFYFTNPHAIIGTEALMTPPPSQKLDYELELGVVIGATPGRGGANLSPEEAKSAIFGYTVFNDWSARDIQSREMKVRLGPAKGKDFATTIGPWIVTADEFADKTDAEGFIHTQMRVWVNGELYGEDNLANIGWPLNEMVAYASRNTMVMPGDLIGSGTCGSGCLAELWGRAGELTPVPLKAGDLVEMEIDGIGRIRNVVGEPFTGPAIPAARKRN